MSFLDIDERLFELMRKVDIVYSPLVDAKSLPAQVDVGILEGSVSNEDDLHKARDFRAHCKIPVSYTHLDVYKRQGIRAGLKILWWQHHEGSTPSRGTTNIASIKLQKTIVQNSGVIYSNILSKMSI